MIIDKGRYLHIDKDICENYTIIEIFYSVTRLLDNSESLDLLMIKD